MRVHSWHVDGQCNLNNCLKLSYGELEFTVLLGLVFFATDRQNRDLLSFEPPQLRRVVKSHLGFYNLAQSGESFGINLRIKRHFIISGSIWPNLMIQTVKVSLFTGKLPYQSFYGALLAEITNF